MSKAKIRVLSIKTGSTQSVLVLEKTRGKMKRKDDGIRPSILVNKKGPIKALFCYRKRTSEWLFALTPDVRVVQVIIGESLFLRKLLWASLPNKRQKLRDR